LKYANRCQQVGREPSRGRCKTEASQKPVPMDELHCTTPSELVADDAVPESGGLGFCFQQQPAGEKRGKQPLWLQTIMRYHIQPVVERLGITNGLLAHLPAHLRQLSSKQRRGHQSCAGADAACSSRVTMDIYAQAQMPQNGRHSRRSLRWYGRSPSHWRSKRALNCSPNCSAAEQGKIAKLLFNLASPTGFEPCYRRESGSEPGKLLKSGGMDSAGKTLSGIVGAAYWTPIGTTQCGAREPCLMEPMHKISSNLSLKSLHAPNWSLTVN